MFNLVENHRVIKMHTLRFTYHRLRSLGYLAVTSLGTYIIARMLIDSTL